MKCKKCKKSIVGSYSKCEDCGVVLCMPCDNNSTYLSWFEVSVEVSVPDVYLCQKCIKKREEPKAEEEKTQ